MKNNFCLAKTIAVTLPFSLSIVSLPLPAFALQIIMGDPEQTVTDNMACGIDNMACDTDDNPGVIQFMMQGIGWKASGKVSEEIGGGSASLRLTNFTIQRVAVAGGAVPFVLVPLQIESTMLNINPPSIARAVLAGNFQDAGNQGNVAVDMFANASQPISGNLNANSQMNQNFNLSTGKINLNQPVTMLDMLLSFFLTDVGDKIILPGSADLFVNIPEPTSTLSLLALGTLGAVSTLKRKLKSSQSIEKETTKVG